MMRNLCLIISLCVMAFHANAQLSSSNTRLSEYLLSTKADTSALLKDTKLMVTEEKSIMSVRPASNVPGYTPKHYGFFCRIEDTAPKGKWLSPRFRLGSVSHVDYLEGKQIASPLPKDY